MYMFLFISNLYQNNNEKKKNRTVKKTSKKVILNFGVMLMYIISIYLWLLIFFQQYTAKHCIKYNIIR